VEHPETRYARSGELSIAYSISGSGPLDIVYVSNWTSHVEETWAWPTYGRFVHRLGTLGRVILMDLPGCGLSDPVSLAELPSVEQWMDYVRVVMDAAGCDRAVLLGDGPATGLAVPLAATHPDRVAGLMLWGGFARIHRSETYPIGIPEEVRETGIAWWLKRWGTGRQLELTGPELLDDPYEVEWAARFERLSAPPGVARVFFRMISELDVREILPAVRVPTLVMHRAGDRWISPEHGRYLAERIPGARHVELPGNYHFPFHGDMDAVLAEMRAFLEALPQQQEAERMLATILVTDLVGSTKRAAALGDQRWREVLDRHDAAVREQLERFRGREIKTTGDGFMATFDGAARAVRCAAAIRDALRGLSLDVRAGVHSGEIELRGGGVDGLAVHIAARVAEAAEAGEVLVSQTVKDLTVGARLELEPRGTHALKGVPGEWATYAASV
jgi:class 3 adenylate cyclase/pimeloyl-ACP methyl ester carboxylesterase